MKRNVKAIRVYLILKYIVFFIVIFDTFVAALNISEPMLGKYFRFGMVDINLVNVLSLIIRQYSSFINIIASKCL